VLQHSPCTFSALSATVATCLLGQCAPVGVAVLLDVGDEAHVLLRRPRAPVEPHLGAARRSSSPHTQPLALPPPGLLPPRSLPNTLELWLAWNDQRMK
jgi:hypothetical protein